MTINSEVKEKLKQAELLHEQKWRHQQAAQAVKGCLIIIATVAVIILIPFLYK